MVFVGMSHSYEQYYQAVRRCYRFGQTQSVDIHIVTSDIESAVVRNVMRKKSDCEEMDKEMIARVSSINDLSSARRESSPYIEETVDGDGYTIMMGDCVRRIGEIPDESIGFSILAAVREFVYNSNSDLDMGN